MSFRSELLKTLDTRGYLKDLTDAAGLDAKAAAGPVTAYVGYDLTAPSLHVGSLLSIMLLRRLQKAGHKPIVLLGGATTQIGDPSDKDKQRPLLTSETITANKVSIAKVFRRFLTFGDGPTDAVLVDNADWFSHFGYIEFLRDYGPHFTINRMLTFDSVKRRLDREQPLTFLEFNYMLMQAVDFLHLAREEDCTVQIGGSDQWGNIVNGVELCRRIAEIEAFGVTTPLLTTASGAKMGKTAEGAVWLDDAMLGPYDYWQFWRNTEDADVGRFLRLFTDLPLEEIATLEALEGVAINEAKIRLADEATTLLHGAEAAARAKETAAKVFAEDGVGDDLPSVELNDARLTEGVSITALCQEAGLCASGGEAKRHMKAGAVKLNGDPVRDPVQKLAADDFDGDGVAKLSIGKKKHARILLVR